ncbi:hypothetical protein B0G62_10614 [Paraburkholderia eburnea]|uniref:Uncharacterized protein n=1 Tax=Paraburkholderia eburnea TaxID=1189126 RepID=A0A2S4MA26_9BURK|nr:hypothetical protein [Paraburkholderia eburnea]POR51485.1 hypothetical protein B0G62_10614 [Paraburkholderia eburnea]PRZ22516.1 hypothetical protein BX588_10614 [Paraburkholderia eburnea]
MKPRSLAIPTIFRRGPDSHLAWLAAVVGPWAALAALRPGATGLPLPALCLAPCLALAGWLVLRRLSSTDPEAHLSRNMLLFGTFGMLAGLALDARGPGLALIASQCGAGATPGPLQVSYLHWRALPAMHIGMLSFGLSAVALRGLTRSGTHPSLCVASLRHAACPVWMLVGMTFGSIVCERSGMGFIGGSTFDGSAVVMLGGMFAGMVWGMVAHAAFHRASKRLRRTTIPAT